MNRERSVPSITRDPQALRPNKQPVRPHSFPGGRDVVGDPSRILALGNGVPRVSMSACPAQPELTSGAVRRALQPRGRACHQADSTASCGQTRRRSLLPCSVSVNLKLSPKRALTGPGSSCSRHQWRRPSRPRTPAAGRLAVGSRACWPDSGTRGQRTGGGTTDSAGM